MTEGEEKRGKRSRDHVDHQTDLSDGWHHLLADGHSKYESVVDAIALHIQSGRIRPGDRLPSQRALARQFGVTVATVTKAIEHACRRGLIVTRTGSGTFVCGRPEDEAASDGIVDLSLNTSPISIVAPLLQHSLKALVSSGEPAKLFGRSPLAGTLRNRRAGAAWFALRGLAFDPDQVLITQGAHEGLLCTLASVASAGDAVICERLNYVGLRRIAQLLQLRLVPVDVDREGLDSTALRRYCGDRSIKAIVCTPITHNPTTATLSRTRRAALLRFAKEEAIPIVEDDVYGMLAGADATPLADEWPEGVIIVSSLSKSVSPGIRVGYVGAPRSLVPRIHEAMLMFGWTEPSTQAAIASQLIRSGDAFQSTLLHRTEAARRVDLAMQALGRQLLTPASAVSYHLWVSTGPTPPEVAVAMLRREGILVSPPNEFLIGEIQSPEHALRVCLGAVASTGELTRALRSVARAVAPPP